jgi:osmotically-inducible protein OsmY
MNNRAIVKQIRAALEKDTRINLHRYPITIATQDDGVIVAGEVESVGPKSWLSWQRRKLTVFNGSSIG